MKVQKEIKMKKLMKRYQFFIILAVINMGILAMYPAIGEKSLTITWIIDKLIIIRSLWSS